MPVTVKKPGEKKKEAPNIGGFPSNNLSSNNADKPRSYGGDKKPGSQKII